jgi:hypothetical protein
MSVNAQDRTVCSRRELDEWREREIGWSHDGHSVLRKARTRLDELLQRAIKAVGRHEG